MKAPISQPLAGMRRLAVGAITIVLPPLCLKCRAVVEAPGTLCPACWPSLEFIAQPFCSCCGFPFEFDAAPDGLCGDCARETPAYDKGRAVLRYDDESRPMILGFKHGDKTQLAPAFARWMARAGAALIGDSDIIVPVPLHWHRLMTRRYNQSALIGRRLARLTGLPHRPDLLVRRRATASQGHLSREQRRRNLRGAFAVPERRQGELAGKRVLLVDDVLTTGATAEACARVLRRAGARTVNLLVLARVVRPSVD